VLVSNLGLTAFVKHLLKLVKQVLQPALRESKKTVKRQRPHGLFHFCLLPQQKPWDALSLFIKSIYASWDI
jgi:hypothetical protein